MAGSVFEDLDEVTDLTAMDVVEADVSLGVADLSVSADVGDVFGKVVSEGVPAASSIGVDVPGGTGRELSFLGDI